jgi:hypothetical protein
MSSSETPNQNSTLVISLLASAAGVLLFALIIWLTYLPTHDGQADRVLRQQQELKLRELRAQDKKTLETYAVVSKDEGTYRIPLEKAMELTVANYRKP